MTTPHQPQPHTDGCSCPNHGYCDGSCMNRQQAEREISDRNRNFAGHCQQLIDLLDNYGIGNIAVDEDLDMIEDIRAALAVALQPLPKTPSTTKSHTDGWIEHDGGGVQASMLDVVQVRFRDHERVKDDFISDTGRVAYWTWWHDGGGDDIVRYRVIPNPPSTTQSYNGEIE